MSKIKITAIITLILSTLIIVNVSSQSNKLMSTPGRVLGNSPSNIRNGGLVAQSGDWIYYSNSSDEWGLLYKVKTDGTQKTKLTDYPVKFINVLDEWVYFSDNLFNEISYLIKIKTDGTNQTIISEEPAYGVILNDNWIYYSNRFIYRMDKDGGNKSKIA
ncbi:MAG: DUF5050 domain-containing protein, partial [Firmicutes bacterium]|nr:DUF5050 domain-containing protein [Bacillota bacterium]